VSVSPDIFSASQALRLGELVVFPTETVYGLGANALDPLAVAKIFEVKGRPLFNPLIVHVADCEALTPLVTHLPEAARRLAETFWPGPLTLVLPKGERVPDIVCAGLPTVAVRIPRHPVAQALLRQARVPVAAPSANRFTEISPTTVEHARRSLGDRVGYYLDGGSCDVGLESTIVGFLGETPTLLRAGGIPQESIEDLLGQKLEMPGPQDILAPGMLKKHYSPRTSVSQSVGTPERAGLLAFTTQPDEAAFAATEILSRRENFQEAAANLYAALRRLDEQGLSAIEIRFAPEWGLGKAINDRLRRALG